MAESYYNNTVVINLIYCEIIYFHRIQVVIMYNLHLFNVFALYHIIFLMSIVFIFSLDFNLKFFSKSSTICLIVLD